MISVNTKLIALLGNPLRQSLSAQMQNAAIASYGLNYVYFPIETTARSLPVIVRAIRSMNFAGFGVTKPNKISVVTLLDEIDEFAAKTGAVNTVVAENGGRLKGYNTDAAGFLRSLGEHFEKPLNESIFLCLGAGGVAKAICSALAYHGAKSILVTSLFDSDSRVLAANINSNFIPAAAMVPWKDKKTVRYWASCADVIINATGVGMGEHTGESPVDIDVFHTGMLAFDAAYNPPVTKFLADAKRNGCETFNGLDMLLYQGIIQFEKWTGISAPEAVMRGALEKAMLAEGIQKGEENDC